LYIEIENVYFQYSSSLYPSHTALRDISLSINAGESLAIVGASGSGKTTLIQHFNGLLQPSQGRVLIDCRNLADPYINLHKIRSRLGLVFQFPEYQLFEETVYNDVAFGPKNSGINDDEVDLCVRKSLKCVGLDYEKFYNRSPFNLSGGEKRRVAIAGVLSMEPEVLVLDEPTVGLDWKSARLVEDIILNYQKLNKTVIFVSHDMDLVARLARKIVVMKQGRIIFNGLKESLFENEALLKDAGLVLPRVCRFMKNLRKKRIDVRMNVFSVEEAKEEIRRVILG
jgi:energy-coupling factor transport system ATP-binding protein